MNDAALRLVLIVIAAITVASGLAQLVAPATVLAIVGGSVTPPAPHLFATVGMFMLITGAMFLQSLLHRSAERAIPLWIGVQKLLAAALVFWGVQTGVFSAIALGVAGLDLLTGMLALFFFARLPR